MPRQVAERRDVVPALGKVFRERGFSGASIAEITGRTGLGKGSLYYFFPGGKKQMAGAVLEDAAAWFEINVFKMLRESKDPGHGIKNMFAAVDRYFHSGRRICLLGAFALDDTRDQFTVEVSAYFSSWIRALTTALMRGGCNAREAKATAEDIVAGIQGALVLSRSQDDPNVFTRTLKRLQNRVLSGCGE